MRTHLRLASIAAVLAVAASGCAGQSNAYSLGDESETIDEVEAVDVEELSAYLVNQRLQERLKHWCAELGAGRVVA